MTTPNQVKFTQENGEKHQFAVKYRRPLDISQLHRLPGIKVEVFAEGLSQPRQMAMGNKVLYVGSSAIPSYVYEGRIANFIYALPLNAEGKPTGIYIVASGLEEPTAWCTAMVTCSTPPRAGSIGYAILTVRTPTLNLSECLPSPQMTQKRR